MALSVSSSDKEHSREGKTGMMLYWSLSSSTGDSIRVRGGLLM